MGHLFDQENAEKLAAIRFFKENTIDLQVNQKEFVAIRDVYHSNFQIYSLKGFSAQERNRLLMRETCLGDHISNEVAESKNK